MQKIENHTMKRASHGKLGTFQKSKDAVKNPQHLEARAEKKTHKKQQVQKLQRAGDFRGHGPPRPGHCLHHHPLAGRKAAARGVHNRPGDVDVPLAGHVRNRKMPHCHRNGSLLAAHTRQLNHCRQIRESRKRQKCGTRQWSRALYTTAKRHTAKKFCPT